MVHTTQTARTSNFELYRIIVMFFIVCHHYVINSGLMEVMFNDPLCANSLFYYIFGAWGKTGINCFVLITGYFMCKSNITLRKFLKLYLQVALYTLLIYSCFVLSGNVEFSLKYFVKLFIPFRHIISDNFVHAFMVWWLFIPFLNAMINNLTKRQHKWLIYLMLTLFLIYQYLPDFGVSPNPICWFSTLYFIASYIRLYPTSIYKNDCASIWGLFTFVAFCLGVVSIVLTLYYNNSHEEGVFEYWLVSDSNSPIALLLSLCSFMFFKNLRIKQNKIINAIAATTFGVLLIHTNGDYMRNFLWGRIIDCKGHYDCDYFWLYAIVSCIFVFVICSFIDYVRMNTVESIFFRFYDSIRIKK